MKDFLLGLAIAAVALTLKLPVDRDRGAVAWVATVTASLWVPGQMPGLNDLIAAAKGFGGRGVAYAKLKKQWTETVWGLAKRERLPYFERASFAFEWRESSRRRDPDNVAAGGRKIILDGLVLANVLPGDGWAHVARWIDRFEVCGFPGVLVTITEARE